MNDRTYDIIVIGNSKNEGSLIIFRSYLITRMLNYNKVL